MKKLIIPILFLMAMGCKNKEMQVSLLQDGKEISLTKAELHDKIKGGWAGQVIGCTYGGPTEFQYLGTMIQDYEPIIWNDTLMLHYYKNWAGLYDDIYMDLTFVNVMEKDGLDAPAISHARAFAHADYSLWHANQAARFNILNGLTPPESGHWKNNPHADDIDFQIEADFAGLMTPGMPVSASEICDKIGHIMNYGDGWYGGVYVATMYSLAFVSNDVHFIVNEALKAIPEQSTFHQCISDVIKWHNEYPGDWKRTWFECEKKWSSDIGCPEGVFKAFNIDAKINAAYMIIGMLYGNGNYGKTIDISTRCGQDSDCNPASVAGILGTMMGYSNIPGYWKQGLDKVEHLNFNHTDISLNKAYEVGMKHALEMVGRNGGNTNNDTVNIKYQDVKPVGLEQCFKGITPTREIRFGWKGKDLEENQNSYSFEFEGCGFVIPGILTNHTTPDTLIKVDITIDGTTKTIEMPTNWKRRKTDIYWIYDLPEGHHEVDVKAYLEGTTKLNMSRILIYAKK